MKKFVLFFVQRREWVKSMILIGSPEIKNKSVVRDRIKIKFYIFITKKTCNLFDEKDKEQKRKIFYKNLEKM